MPKEQTKPWSDDEINKFLKSRGHEPGSVETGAPGKVAPAGNQLNEFIEQQPLISGVGQGLANYAESPAYYAEKGVQTVNPDFRMPLHARAADVKRRVESTTAGNIGEFAGMMIPAFLPGLGELAGARAGAAGARLLPAAGRGALGGAVGGAMANPATSLEQFRDQAALGALLGGVGGQAGARLESLAAQKTAERAARARRAVTSGTIRRTAEEDLRARSAPEMRYTGEGDRFEPVRPEGPLPKAPFRDIPKEPKYGPTRRRTFGQQLGHIAARGAGFTLGHMTPIPGLHRVLGHTYADTFARALEHMNHGELSGLREYIDTALARSGRTRSSLVSRGGAAGGAIGSYEPLATADRITGGPERPDFMGGDQ